MNPSKKILLYLCSAHLEAYFWNGKALSEAEIFAHDQKGIEQFLTFLQKHTEPAYLLTDVIEQDFRHEAIPHINGRLRRDMIERRLEQYFRNTPFRQARIQGQYKSDRRDDEVLFSALTNPQHIQPWLECLTRNHTPLAGIYSLPDISANLIDMLQSEHVLLLSWEKHAGLRQSYFHNKKLHLSRLTQLDDATSLCEAVATEIPRMLNYLNSLNLPQSKTTEICILCHAQDFARLDDVLRRSPDLQYTCLDIQKVGAATKLNQKFESSDSSALFLHLLARHPPAIQYANHVHTRHHRLWKIRRALWFLALASVSTGLSWAASDTWHGYEYTARTAPLLSQTTYLFREIESLKQNFPDTGASATEMKAVVTLMHTLDSIFPAPENILSPLAEVLEEFTQLRTHKLTWQTDTTSATSFPVIDLDGELLQFGSDHRGAIAYLNEFQQQLTLHGYTVISQKLPVDTSPQGSISGGTRDEPDKLARFSLKLAWKSSP